LSVYNQNASGRLVVKCVFFRSNFADIYRVGERRMLLNAPQASQMLDTTLKTAVHRGSKFGIDSSFFIYENESHKVSRQMTRFSTSQ